jgi:hypothetical protein
MDENLGPIPSTIQKINQSLCYLQETLLASRDKPDKKWKNETSYSKQAGEPIIISDKADFKANLERIKKVTLNNNKGNNT